MKKLMIAATIAALTVAGNAATVSWGAGGYVVNPSGEATTDGTVFLFLTGASGAPVWDSEKGAWDMKGATLVTMMLGDKTITGANYDSETGMWGYFDASSKSSLPSSDQITDAGEQEFAIILTSEKTSDLESFKGDDKYAVVMTGVSEQTSGFEESGGVFYYESMVAWDDVTQGSWTQLKTDAVPEPTSGLLLLLGVAGLALKRKRA